MVLTEQAPTYESIYRVDLLSPFQHKLGGLLEMKFSNSLLAVAMTIASLSFTLSAKAGTVDARCDAYPKGEDRATSSKSIARSRCSGDILAR